MSDSRRGGCQWCARRVQYCWVNIPTCDSPTCGWWWWAVCAGTRSSCCSPVATTWLSNWEKSRNKGKLRGVCVCVCERACVCVSRITVCGFAETASTDKQMCLGDVVIITIYPHGLVRCDSAPFMGLFVDDKVTVTVINLVILRVPRTVW